MLIDVLVPTRERPAMAERAALSALEMAGNKKAIRVSIAIDFDDPRRNDYESMALKHGFNVVVHEGNGSAPACIETAIKATSGDVIVVFCDDLIARSKDWDARLEEIFATNPYLMVSPNNGRHRRKLEHPICTRKWVEAAGCLFPDYGHFYADEYIEKVAQQASLIYYAMDIIFEHMHPKYAKAMWDDVYLRKRLSSQMEKDRDRFNQAQTSIEQMALKVFTAASEYRKQHAA